MTPDNIPLSPGEICGAVILFIASIVLVLPSFLLSRLIKIEHDDFPAQWERDGRPYVMPFWFPVQELGLLNVRSNPWSMGYLWLFKTPEWVKGHQAASKLFKYYRFTSYFIFMASFSICLLIFLTMPR